MPYNFYVAQNVMNIQEQQFGTADEIRFSNFTSCIGIIARDGNNVTGVHLVMVADDGTAFDNTAANAAIQLLPNYQRVVVIGQTGMWADNLPGPYQTLINGLQNPVIRDRNNGTYGGRVDNGTFQTYENGQYYNV